MSKLLVIVAVTLFSISSFACQCLSDSGFIYDEDKARIKELLGVKEVHFTEETGHLSLLAMTDPETYFSNCGCSKYYTTVAKASYVFNGELCSATVKVKNWNRKIIIQNDFCPSEQ
jgi:hypothetical protein